MEGTSNHPNNPKKETKGEPNIDPNEFPIKKELTLDDVRIKRYINLNKEEVKEHIRRHLTGDEVKRVSTDDVKIIMVDLDTNTEHEVNFRHYKNDDKYYLQGLWRYNFVERRSLSAGDVIGIKFKYDQKLHGSSKLFFRVLKRSTTPTQKRERPEETDYDITQ